MDADALPDPINADLLAMGEGLDGLSVAMCVFDEHDRSLAWNRCFLRFFPEHDGFVYAGEPYQDNLRRFYRGRLSAEELPAIERYIERGVARHRSQQRPYEFEHRGRRLLVSSLPLPGTGRVRLWKEQLQPTEPASAVLAGAELLERVPDGVMVCAPGGQIRWVNQAFAVMYGLVDPASAAGRDFDSIYRQAWILDGAASAAFADGLATLKDNLRFEGAPFELPLPGNRWTRVVAQRSPDGNGFHAHVDITLQKRQQQELAQTEAAIRKSKAMLHAKSTLLEATLERMDQGVVMVNAQGRIEICNRRAIELTGLPADVVEGKPLFADVLDYQWAHEEFTQASSELQSLLRDRQMLLLTHRYDRVRPDGRIIEVHNVPLEGGGALRTYTDVTERKRSEEHIRHVAQHDSLTSLVNRAAFHEAVSAAAREGAATGRRFAVHYIDLDRFKPVNDRHGHGTGDAVLVKLAERMRMVARDADVVARLGGDEFAVLQYGVGASEAAQGLAQRLLEALCEPVQVGSVEVCIGASIGIALYPDAGTDAVELIASADRAMYAGKARGRRQFTLFAGTDDDSFPDQPISIH